MADRSEINLLVPSGISRRELLKIVAAAAATSGVGINMARAEETLNLFTWTTYGEQPFIAFSAENNFTIRPTFFASTDEMLAKLRGGGTRLYDMAVPLQSAVPLMAELGLIEPMDKSRFTNLEGVFPEFVGTPEWEFDGKFYGVPFVWGANAIAYNKAETGELDSLDALFDPKFAGKIGMRDEPEDSLAIGALKLGIKQPYQMDESALQEVKKLMISQKPLVRAYWKSIADVQTMLASGEVVVSWGFLAIVKPLREQGVDIQWLWPKEGAIGWNEGIVLVAGSQNKQAVEDYANLTISPEYGVMMGEKSRYATSSRAAVEKMGPEMAADLGIDPATMSQLVFKQHLPNRARWVDIWNEVKAA